MKKLLISLAIALSLSAGIAFADDYSVPEVPDPTPVAPLTSEPGSTIDNPIIIDIDPRPYLNGPNTPNEQNLQNYGDDVQQAIDNQWKPREE